MRAGQLKDAATLVDQNGYPVGAVQLVGLEDKDTGIGFSEGLKSNAKIIIRSRWQPPLVPGNYWHIGPRVFLVNGVSNPDGSQRDAISSCTEFVGAMVIILALGEPQDGAQVKCALTQYCVKPQGEHEFLSAGVETERRTAEFISSQYRPVIGHEFTLAGAQYRIIEHDSETSDSHVSAAWVEFLGYQ
jgi:hypothetical protein